jgi:hypothetical protein
MANGSDILPTEMALFTNFNGYYCPKITKKWWHLPSLKKW